MIRFRLPLSFIVFFLHAGDLFATPLENEAQEEENGIEVIVVTGVRTHETLQIETSEITQPGLDNSDLLRMFPGGNRNSNGPITRISQYRGLFGAQNNVSVDGLGYTAGGPNWMDSPLSSIPQSLTGSVTLHRGLGTVVIIEEGLGGAIEIESRRGDFSSSPEWTGFGNASANYGSNASAFGAAAWLGAHNADNWIGLAASYDHGDDYEFSGGVVAATEYERSQYRLGYGHDFDPAELTLGLVINRTGDSGTPALPMDIRYVDSEQVSLGLETPGASGSISFQVNALWVEHLMDNFTLRPVPVNAMGMPSYRQTVAVGDSGGFKLSYSRDLGGSSLVFGLDGRIEDHDADITNPKNDMFYVTNFNDVERDRTGIFAQISSTAGAWDLEAGARYNRVAMDAGEVGGNLATMMMAQQERLDKLAAEFNAADRNRKNNQWSGIFKASRDLFRNTRLNLGLGRKVRSPSYQERYLWLPMEATAGLADGYTYIGDIALKPESSIEVTAGLEFALDDFRLTPEVFYRDVDNYIQGVPSTNMTANLFAMMMTGKKPLQFANVDAELYGVDLGYEWEISNCWLLRGSLSWVRGRRTDVADNLYRIAPLTSVLELIYVRERFFISMQSVAESRQDKVSAFNDEQETPGWGILNLRGGFELNPIFNLALGVENIFDKAYRDHLGGYNRVQGSAVPVGTGLYSQGRNFYLKLNASW